MRSQSRILIKGFSLGWILFSYAIIIKLLLNFIRWYMKNIEYINAARATMTDEDRKLIRAFISEFEKTHIINNLELRISGKEVRGFLKNHASTMSLIRFNRITGCLGATSYNNYAYSIATLYSLISDERGREHKSSFPGDWIFCIEWYGSKKQFKTEWEVLLQYAKAIGCNSMIDAMAGSGYISLLASKHKLFIPIIQNDASTELYNYYCSMKKEKLFEAFIHELQILPVPTRQSFNLLRENFYSIDRSDEKRVSTEITNREVRKQLQSVNPRRAAQLFYLQHYSYQAAGKFVSDRKSLTFYIDSLKKTHELYKNIQIKNWTCSRIIDVQLENPEYLIILDPPYLKKLRVRKQVYTIEFTEAQHRYLLKKICNARARVILCGFKNKEDDLYSRYLKQSSINIWHCFKINRKSISGKTEYIWVNFVVDELILNNSSLFTLIY